MLMFLLNMTHFHIKPHANTYISNSTHLLRVTTRLSILKHNPITKHFKIHKYYTNAYFHFPAVHTHPTTPDRTIELIFACFI